MDQASTPSATTPSDIGSEQVVQQAIAEISHIATLPEVTLKIIRLVEDPESTASDLNQVISNDPALGARILKVVNSAFYGLPGQIGSINRAIVLLGLNAVKNIAIAASLAKLFRGGQISPHFNARELWKHSIAVATGTRLLATEVGLGLPDEAFLAGLIHDLGIMVEMQARRPQFVQVIEKVHEQPGTTLRAAETELLSANHEQFGAGLCKLWKFPVSFAYVTGYHHRPWDLAQPNRVLTNLVYVADILAAQQSIGYTKTIESPDPASSVLQELELKTDQVDKVAQQLEQATSDAEALFAAS